MVEFKVGNCYAVVSGVSKDQIDLLREWTSFPLVGAKYLMKRVPWHDGREHLMRYDRKNKTYHFPTGVLGDITQVFDNRGFDYVVIDDRTRHAKTEEFAWHFDKPLYNHQLESTKSIVDSNWQDDPTCGRGLIRAPVRSGKTVAAAWIIRILGRKALYIVHTKEIFHQTVRAYQGIFGKDAVGIVHESTFDLRPITIALVQSLMSKPDSLESIRRHGVGVLIMDEAHHARGEKWRNYMMGIDCEFRIGLSGTIYVSHRRENELRAICMVATFGPVRYSISIRKLQSLGILKPIRMEFYRISKPTHIKKWTWRGGKARSEGIIDNRHRNDLIAKLVRRSVVAGRRVMVVANEHRHILNICELLDPGSYRVVFGLIKDEVRQESIREFRQGRYLVLIGNVIGEGLDVPECDDMINCAGGAARETAIQRLRNMTQSKGKKFGVYIDFMDCTQRNLQKHSEQRWQHFLREECFDMKEIDPDKEIPNPFI